MFDLAKEWEELTMRGYAPQLIYDDDGHFAVADEGIGSIRMSSEDSFSMELWGEPEWFKDTPQEAWDDYIMRMRELGNDDV